MPDFPEVPPEMMAMLEQVQQQMFQMIAPILRANVRDVLERNDKLVNQDQTALDFLTEELINAIMRPPVQ